jgi:hypothetical protein
MDSQNKRNVLAWVYGLAAAFVQGGAAALAATMTASLIAPEKFNLGEQLRNFLSMAGVTFVVSGVLGAAGYLKQSPLPPITADDGPRDQNGQGLPVAMLVATALAFSGCASFDKAYRSTTQEDDISIQGGYDVETKDANGQVVWRHVYRDPSK